MTLRIVVTDILDHPSNHLGVVWQCAVLHLVAEELTKQTAKLLAAWITHHTTRVREHTDKVGKQTEVRQGIELPGHPFPLVEKPPPASELHLGTAGFLEGVTGFGIRCDPQGMGLDVGIHDFYYFS